MPTFTLAALKQRCYDNLDITPGLYPADQVTANLNEGLRRLNLLVGWNQDTISVPGFSVANQLIYSVPAGLTLPMTVWFEERRLDKISIESIGMKYRNWVTDLTSTAGPVTRWVPIGTSRFACHPIDSSGGRLIEVTGLADVVPLVSDADVVNLEDQFVDALINYVRSRIRIKEGGSRFAQDSLAYQQMVSQVKPWLIWQGMKFPQYFVKRQFEPAEGRGT